jgi:hypothetical protein
MHYFPSRDCSIGHPMPMSHYPDDVTLPHIAGRNSIKIARAGLTACVRRYCLCPSFGLCDNPLADPLDPSQAELFGLATLPFALHHLQTVNDDERQACHPTRAIWR